MTESWERRATSNLKFSLERHAFKRRSEQSNIPRSMAQVVVKARHPELLNRNEWKVSKAFVSNTHEMIWMMLYFYIFAYCLVFDVR